MVGNAVHNSYSPFGVRGAGSEAVEQALGYAGAVYDTDTELTYLRDRYYSPRLKRFLSEDPIGLDGGINPYTYVGNSPLNGRDPTGECPEEAGGDGKTETYEDCPEGSSGWYAYREATGKGITFWNTLGGILASCWESVSCQLTLGAGGAAASIPRILSGLRASAGVSLFSGTAAAGGGRAVVHVFTRESVKRMAERGVTRDMVFTALEKGTRFWDPKNGAINFVLESAFASGKDLLVGVAPGSGRIMTVIRGTGLVVERFIPYPF